MITKVEVLDETSTFNSVGEDHYIEFEILPVLRARFYVRENDNEWSTSVVTSLQVMNDNTTVITTLYSIYILTIA